MKMKNLMNALLLGSALTMTGVQAEPVLLDKVAAVVDRGVILESDVRELLNNIKRSAEQAKQPLPSESVLRTQALDRLIMEQLQLQMAQRIGLKISDAQLDQTVRNIAADQGLTLEQLKRAIEKDGGNYARYRENVRTELTLGEVRRIAVGRRIQISPQEVEAMVAQLNEQGAENLEYRLGHILIQLPSGADSKALNETRERAEKVLKRLEDGEDFARLAILSSSGAKALEGGDLGWVNANEVPTLFADALKGAKQGQIIGPLRSGAGFHIVKVSDMRGLETVEVQEINARHILIKPSIIVSDDKARETLEELAGQIKSGEMSFEEAAREHSEDPGSARKGGELGWSDPNIYVPAFRDALARLQPGEYAAPFRSVHGWHLVQLIDRRTTDATDKATQDRAYRLLFNRKFNEEAMAWLRELRNQAYIDLLEDDA
ncbi:peptidylprolyl isomerase SurA [Gallaecimonas sp. GXIMD4217]|uniref:peptidylprolyl isomerase SurA n=1 Tax=Gallaecimonas sp. GXIMD4217 TaxID=3131927 RepID=UPI00311B25DB